MPNEKVVDIVVKRFVETMNIKAKQNAVQEVWTP